METGCKKLLIILNLVYISRYIGRDIKERVSIFFFFFFYYLSKLKYFQFTKTQIRR